MSPPPGTTQAVTDALLALTEAEDESLIRRLTEPLPALAKASDHIRGVLLSLESDRAARHRALSDLLKSWHLSPPPSRPLPAGGPDHDPFFPLLSLRFLLIKTAEAQQLLLSRYQNAASTLPPPHPPLLTTHLSLLRTGLTRLTHELKSMGLDPPPEL